MTTLKVDAPAIAERTAASGGERRRRRRVPTWALAVFGSLGALLVWSRGIHLTEPLWTDEAWSLYAYVPHGPGRIMFGDYEINNHILFELLTWATSRVTGESEASYRLWAFIPALGSVAWLTVWLWGRIGRVAALAFAFLVTLAPLHLDLSRQSRGYGLTYLAIAGLIVFGDSYNRTGRRRDVALFALSGLIGTYTFPFFGFAFAFAAVALVANRRRWRGVVIAVGVAGGVFLLLMAHAFPQLRQSAGDFKVHTRIEVLGWGENLLWPLRIIGPTFGFSVDGVDEIRIRMWQPTDWEMFVVTVLVYPLLAFAVVHLVRREGRLAALLLLPIVGTFLYVTIQRMAVWERYTSFYLYPTVIVLAFGAEQLVRVARRNNLARALTLSGLIVLSYPLLRAVIGTRPAAFGIAAVAVVAGVVALWRMSRNAWEWLLRAAFALAAVPLVAGFVGATRGMREPPREDFAGAAEIVEKLDNPTLLTTRTSAASLYYLGLADYSLGRFNSPYWMKANGRRVRFVTDAEMNWLLCATPAPLAFVAPASDLRAVNANCLEDRGAKRTTLPMLLFGGGLEVWSLDSSPGITADSEQR